MPRRRPRRRSRRSTAPIAFNRPLTEGGDAVRGKSLEELIQGSPLFPPIEGLPDEVWKGKHCSDCHQWRPPDAVRPGQFLLNNQVPDAFGAIHPLGGQFRQVLKAWAAQGCK